jgi:hypothetical protein
MDAEKSPKKPTPQKTADGQSVQPPAVSTPDTSNEETSTPSQDPTETFSVAAHILSLGKIPFDDSP